MGTGKQVQSGHRLPAGAGVHRQASGILRPNSALTIHSHFRLWEFTSTFFSQLRPFVSRPLSDISYFEARCSRSPHHWPAYISEGTEIIYTRLTCIRLLPNMPKNNFLRKHSYNA